MVAGSGSIPGHPVALLVLQNLVAGLFNKPCSPRHFGDQGF